jgi:hypothetical protein
VFIDATGNKDCSDPINPTFGRGAALGAGYRTLIKKPWRKLKRKKLGVASEPFRANELTVEANCHANISYKSVGAFVGRGNEW